MPPLGQSAVVMCSPDNAGLILPKGFCASIFADSLGRARYVTVAPNGDVYVALEGTRPAPAGQTAQAPAAAFVALRDSNGDGKADVIQRGGVRGNTGILVRKSYLYVDEGERIVRYAMAPGQLLPATQPEVIVDEIPLNPGHRARNFAFAPDGSLFVNVGSPSNACQVKDRGLESPGIDPCTQLATRAGIWKFDGNRPGQTFTAATRFATGARNSTGMAFANGQLWAMTHGRDQLHENWPKIFPDSEYGSNNPAESLLRVNEGDDFGWPYCYYSVDLMKLVDAPEYGGDGKKTTRCATKEAPAAVYPAHWSPLDLLIYSGNAFPASYQNGAFITFHGSWNRARGMQAGGKIVFQPMSAGRPSGRYVIFADGFAGVPPEEIEPSKAKHRPVGLAIAPDGSLYVADDAGGRIYKISYTGVR